ncbi:hypothetical protein L345_04087, partial [Ophiophagus hannah]
MQTKLIFFNRKFISRLERNSDIRDHSSIYDAQQRRTSSKVKGNNKKEKVQGGIRRRHVNIINEKVKRIGPHLDIFEAFKKLRKVPTTEKIASAATCIQKLFKGWYERSKLNRIKLKVPYSALFLHHVESALNSGSKNISLTKIQVIEIAFMLYPPVGLQLRTAAAPRSTWVKPIVDGEDSYMYLGKHF